jgi:hypothetical protein
LSQARFSDDLVAAFSGTESKSPDGRWFVSQSGKHVILVDLEFKNTIAAKAYREFKARLRPSWHVQMARIALHDNDWFAATCHRAWQLKADPLSALAYYLRIKNASP